MQLPSGYRIVEMPTDEFQKYWSEWGPKVFHQNSTSLDTKKILSEEETSHLRKLNQNFSNMIRLNLAVFHGDEFCGWFTGDQHNYETFYMRNSAILPEHRRKGLYTALMTEVIKRVKDLGFQIILSRHSVTNNSIIVPKLKAGFIITSIEISDRFGALVHLNYFFNESRKQVMDFRAGDLKPDQKLKEALRLD